MRGGTKKEEEEIKRRKEKKKGDEREKCSGYKVLTLFLLKVTRNNREQLTSKFEQRSRGRVQAGSRGTSNLENEEIDGGRTQRVPLVNPAGNLSDTTQEQRIVTKSGRLG